MNTKRYIALYVALICCIVGCASSSKQGGTAHSEPAFANTVPFRYAVDQQGADLHFLISASFINKLGEPIPLEYTTLDWSELYIYDSTGNLLMHNKKTITGKKSETSLPEVVEMTPYSEYTWKPDGNITQPLTGKARVMAYKQGDIKVFDSTITYTYMPLPPKPLSMRIDIEAQDNRQFLINLTVTRVANVANEFLPNSLTHDYKIYDSQDRLLWQMSYQKMYMQVITDVAPKNIGEQTFYTDLWTGEGNVVPGFVPSGEYKLVAIIPCKPEPVQDSVLFKIK